MSVPLIRRSGALRRLYRLEEAPQKGDGRVGRLAKRWAVAAAFLFLAGGCGNDSAIQDDESEPVALERIGDPGVDRSPFEATYGSATAAGSDLVVIDAGSGANRHRTALRREDGTWWQLPDLPFTGYIQLASANDRAVAGGVACTDSGCDRGELAFAMLSDDYTEWIRLDAPPVEFLPTETELTTGPGLSEFAGFVIGTGYKVNQRGDVSEWVWNPKHLPGTVTGGDGVVNEVGCSDNETYYSVRTAFPNPANVGFGTVGNLTGDIYSQPLDGSGEPEPLAPAPDSAAVSFETLCTGGAVTVYGPGSAASFDIESGAWTTGPSNLQELTSWVSPISGRFATGSDGTAYLRADPGGDVIRQVDRGMWETTGAKGHVFPTSEEIVIIGDDRSITTFESG